jgi:hypothetical protein
VLVRRIIVDFGGFYFSKALFAGMPTFWLSMPSEGQGPLMPGFRQMLGPSFSSSWYLFLLPLFFASFAFTVSFLLSLSHHFSLDGFHKYNNLRNGKPQRNMVSQWLWRMRFTLQQRLYQQSGVFLLHQRWRLGMSRQIMGATKVAWTKVRPPPPSPFRIERVQLGQSGFTMFKESALVRNQMQDQSFVRPSRSVVLFWNMSKTFYIAYLWLRKRRWWWHWLTVGFVGLLIEIQMIYWRMFGRINIGVAVDRRHHASRSTSCHTMLAQLNIFSCFRVCNNGVLVVRVLFIIIIFVHMYCTWGLMYKWTHWQNVHLIMYDERNYVSMYSVCICHVHTVPVAFNQVLSWKDSFDGLVTLVSNSFIKLCLGMLRETDSTVHVQEMYHYPRFYLLPWVITRLSLFSGVIVSVRVIIPIFHFTLINWQNLPYFH